MRPVVLVVSNLLYTAALLVRPVLDALDAVPSHVISAAIAIGYRPVRRFLGVELPLAVPVLTAGVRVVSVSNLGVRLEVAQQVPAVLRHHRGRRR